MSTDSDARAAASCVALAPETMGLDSSAHAYARRDRFQWSPADGDFIQQCPFRRAVRALRRRRPSRSPVRSRSNTAQRLGALNQLPKHVGQNSSVTVIGQLDRRVDARDYGELELATIRRSGPARSVARVARDCPSTRRYRMSRIRSTQRSCGSRRPRIRAATLPSPRDSSDGFARTTRRSRRERRAGGCPWPPSRATSPFHIPYPR